MLWNKSAIACHMCWLAAQSHCSPSLVLAPEAVGQPMTGLYAACALTAAF